MTDDLIVRENAKESLNFYINIYIYALTLFALTLVNVNLFIFGFLMIILLFTGSLILAIVALTKVLNNPSQPYHYPFIFRLF